MPSHHVEAWRRRSSGSPLQCAAAFVDDRLVIGCGTILLDRESMSKVVTLAVDRAHDRMVTLLAVAGRGRLAKGALRQLDVALEDWRSGDRALAAIRLAFASLPRVGGPDEAHALFLAETAFDVGLGSKDLLRELGYVGCVPLLKDWRTQPRVPACSGPTSGQWTCDAPGVSFAPSPASVPAAFKPIGDGDGTLKPVPVFLRPEDGDAEQTEEDKARRLLDHSVQEQIREGRPLPTEVPGGFEIVPLPDGADTGGADPAAPAPGSKPVPQVDPAPGGGEATRPVLPQADAVPGPQPKPASGGGGSSRDSPLRDDEGPPCPEPQDDRPRGANFNADVFEYTQSRLVNPLNPTPKWSPDRPTVRSQAYYLPTLTPDGKTSYDDCKKDKTPIRIPGVKPGDVFDFKAKNAGWPLYYRNTTAYEKLHEQIRRQNEGVTREGRGRRVFYCWETQALADKAYSVLHEEFPGSRFVKCD